MNRLHEILVVEERFPHTHEYKIHALGWRGDALLAQDSDDLTDDFSSLQVSLYAQQGGEAETAVNGTAHLA